MKIMDAGRIEVESAAKAGASLIDVLGTATDATIEECIQAAKNYGAHIVVDLIAVKDPVERARQVEALGADYISVHVAIDEPMRGLDPFATLQAVSQAVKVPVGVAGGINSETAAQAVAHGAAYVIVGGAITKAKDPESATRDIRRALDEGAVIPTDLSKGPGRRKSWRCCARYPPPICPTPCTGAGCWMGSPLFPGIRLMGRALTVRTYRPGPLAERPDDRGPGAVDEAHRIAPHAGPS